MIEILKRLSPVPVYFIDTDMMTFPVFAGTYIRFGNYSGKEICIEIDNNLTKGQKIATLIHEIGHTLCDSKGCKCMKNPDHTKREIHADRFMLTQLLKYNQKEQLKEEIKYMKKRAHGLTSHEYYVDAAKYIMKTKLWQKCLDYVNNP